MTINKINVNGVSYDIVDTNTVTSINGKTGAIAASDIAAVLTAAGHKLTDTNTWNAANSSQAGYVPKSAANKILRADGSGVLYWGDDTNSWRPVSDSVTSTSSSDAASSKAVKTAYDLAASKTANTGTVTSVATGAGLTGGTITGSGTIKANLVSETKLGSAANTGRIYPVALDSNNKLAVSVPWTNTDTHGTLSSSFTPDTSGGSVGTLTISFS